MDVQRRRGSTLAILAIVTTGLMGCATAAAPTAAPSPTAGSPSGGPSAVPAATAAATGTATASAPAATQPVPTASQALGPGGGPDLKIDELITTSGDAPGTAPWLRIQGVKCGGPIGTWSFTANGTRAMSGLAFVVTGSGTATLAGTATTAAGSFTMGYDMAVEGIPLSVGGQRLAQYEGTSTFGNGTLTLDGRVTGTSVGENPYRQVTMAMFPSTQVTILSVRSGTYC